MPRPSGASTRTRVSLSPSLSFFPPSQFGRSSSPFSLLFSRAYEPEIGDVNEGIVERGEDAGNWTSSSQNFLPIIPGAIFMQKLTAENELALTDLGAQGDVLLGGTSDLLGGHFGGLTVTLGLGGVVCCKVSISSFPVVTIWRGSWCDAECPWKGGGARQIGGDRLPLLVVHKVKSPNEIRTPLCVRISALARRLPIFLKTK